MASKKRQKITNETKIAIIEMKLTSSKSDEIIAEKSSKNYHGESES
ncbi:unnamed protein product, partial [Brachionus calyciflorus]